MRMSSSTSRIKKIKDYDAPWRQDYISQDLLLALSSRVEQSLEEVTPESTLLKPTLVFDSGPAAARAGLAPAQQPGQGNLLDAFRQRLGTKFGSLKNAFDAMDHNKDGLITFAELKTALERNGCPWTETNPERDLRAAFRALANDPHKVRLSVADFVRGTAEDHVAMAHVTGSREVKEVRKAVPLHRRPKWTRKMQTSNVVHHHLFDMHIVHDVLPEKTSRPLPNYDFKKPYEEVLERTDQHFERCQKTIDKHTQLQEEQHNKQVTLKPKLLNKSRQMIQGKHTKPWEDRTHIPPSSRLARVMTDLRLADHQERKEETFQPEIVEKSRKLFRQFHDPSLEWHDRMYGRSKLPKVDRMSLSPKKRTKDFEEEHFRERAPHVSPQVSARLHKAYEHGMSPHEYLHRNYLRDHEAPERPSGPIRSNYSVSFMYRPGAKTPSPIRTLGGTGEASTASPTASPTLVEAWSAAKAESLEPTKIAASMEVVDIVSMCGRYFKAVETEEKEASHHEVSEAEQPGEMSEDQAATKIQSRFRGKKAREALLGAQQQEDEQGGEEEAGEEAEGDAGGAGDGDFGETTLLEGAATLVEADEADFGLPAEASGDVEGLGDEVGAQLPGDPDLGTGAAEGEGEVAGLEGVEGLGDLGVEAGEAGLGPEEQQEQHEQQEGQPGVEGVEGVFEESPPAAEDAAASAPAETPAAGEAMETLDAF